jgi:hypothetical protein
MSKNAFMYGKQHVNKPQVSAQNNDRNPVTTVKANLLNGIVMSSCFPKPEHLFPAFLSRSNKAETNEQIQKPFNN